MSIPSSSSTTQSKVNKPAADLDRVATYRDIVKGLLPNFPAFGEIGDIMYWILASFWLESTWNLHFRHKQSGGSYVYNSLHFGATKPALESISGAPVIKGTGTLMGGGYQYNPVIQNKWNDPAVTTQIRNNIKEGWYPHGISATMGCYHVRGTNNNKGEWRKHPEAVKLIESLGLEVDPGQSIFETLFPTDDETCWKRSIASGMIILNAKYKAYRKNRTPQLALQEALGAYVGKKGAADLFGTTPEMRVAQLNQTSAGFVTPLKKIGVARTGDTTILVDTMDTSSPAGGATSVSNNTPRPATTNSGQTGKSEVGPGCQV